MMGNMKSTVPRETGAVPTAKAPAISAHHPRVVRRKPTATHRSDKTERRQAYAARRSVLPYRGPERPADVCQVSYSVSVAMEKPKYLLGEPIFCRFVIRNTGSTVFAFRYRTPTRSLASDYDQEPRFHSDRRSRTAAARSRPSALRQPARDYRLRLRHPASRASSYRALAAEPMGAICCARPLSRARRAPPGAAPARPSDGKFAEKPAAFALAIDELSVPVVAFHPRAGGGGFSTLSRRHREPQGPRTRPRRWWCSRPCPSPSSSIN